MPVTPLFNVVQDDCSLIIRIRVPHIRVSDAEVALDGSDFSFYCRPYLLNLRLPGGLQQESADPKAEGGGCRAQFIPDELDGTIVVTLKKLNFGEHFEGLDLASALIRPSLLSETLGAAASSAVIEEMSSESFGPQGGQEGLDNATGDNCCGGVADGSGACSSRSDGNRSVSAHQEHAPPPPPPLPAMLLVQPPPASADSSSLLGARPPDGGGGRAEQELLPSLMGSLRLDGARAGERYGFNRRHKGVFTNLRGEVTDVLDARFNPEEPLPLPSPSRTPYYQCRGTACEDEDFDEERYCGDEHQGVGEDPLFLAALDFTPHWHALSYGQSVSVVAVPGVAGAAAAAAAADDVATTNAAAVSGGVISAVAPTDGYNNGSSSGGAGDATLTRGGAATSAEEEGGDDDEAAESPGSAFDWSPEETALMQSLPSREHLMTAAETQAALCAFTSILIGYVYDHRMTCGEGSVESAWTVARLSASLCWLEPFLDLDNNEAAVARPLDALVSGIRRMLCYPYFRSWTLSLLVVRDVSAIFAKGRRCLVRCALAVRKTLSASTGNDHGGYYLLNKVWVDDLAVWLQRVSGASLAAFASQLSADCATVLGSSKGNLLGALGARMEKADTWDDSSEDEDALSNKQESNPSSSSSDDGDSD
eukprot:CAMPEP_0171918106 /NCGR_PEP_ID=MMETSP0993-20121228/16744_1 /TAXON_ID=483369 /ORGANISM="non described non described, Strain CCMP2098" /LENGTH=649 /DNA_ID=CAMNT_0012554277 /DNA_START=43 /DNA_END=1992 /DNA_ORIENTATION=-